MSQKNVGCSGTHIFVTFLFLIIPGFQLFGVILLLLGLYSLKNSSKTFTSTLEKNLSDQGTKDVFERIISYAKEEGNSIQEAVVLESKINKKTPTFESDAPDGVEEVSKINENDDGRNSTVFDFAPKDFIEQTASPYQCPSCGFGTGTKMEVCPRCNKTWR